MQTGPERDARDARGDRGGRSGHYDRPRFRQDLLAELIAEQDGRFIDVMDPDSETIFRFYEVEYSLACGMDGERDVPGIVKWAQEELGLSPTPQEVRTVIATLGDLGFIAAGEAAAQPLTAEPAPSVVVTPQAKPYAVTELAPGPAVDAPRVPGATARRPAQTPDDSALGVPVRASDRPTPRAFEATTPEISVASSASATSGASAVPSAPGAQAASSNISEVSIDLSDHIEVRPDDVKEAVRASKVLSAVEVPKDLLDAIEDRPAERVSDSTTFPKRPSTGSFEPVPALGKPAEIPKPVELARPAEIPKPAELARPAEIPKPVQIPKPAEVTRPVEARVDAKPERSPLSRPPNDTGRARPPVELPEPPVAKPVAPPAPSRRVSPVLIVLLILVVLGAGAFFVWKYVLEGQGTGTETSAKPAIQPVKPPPPAPPPPPPPPAAKIGMVAPPPDEIKIAQPGVIDTIVADGTAVKEGDEIVKLGGYKPLEAGTTAAAGSVARLKAQIETLTKQRDAAQAAGNKAMETTAVADLEERQKALAGKEELLAGRKKDLEKFVIRAPGNGTFTREAKPSAKVVAEAVIGKLQREAIPTATFKVSDTKPFTANASIEVTAGKGEQHVTCTVAEVQPDSVKVVCPADPALAEGTDVTLKVLGAPSETSPPAAAAPGQPAAAAPGQPASAASGQPASEAAGQPAAPAQPATEPSNPK